jgi:hypothetical protein
MQVWTTCRSGGSRDALLAGKAQKHRGFRHSYMAFLVCVLALFVSVPAAHAQIPSDTAPEISLLTIGPGDIFFERFGHNAIVVRDPASGEAIAYNYGMFDFEQEDFLLNFARGRMRYRIAADALDDDLEMYRTEGREITEQRLNLLPAQALELARFLDWNTRPQNRFYHYDYFEANCSTRVRDALDHALGGALHAQSEGRARGYTYRLDALRLMAPEPLLMLGIDLGLGPYADQRIDFWQESFVPATLRSVVSQASTRSTDGQSVPLVAQSSVIASGRVEEPPALPPDLRWPFLIAGIAIGCLLLWLRHPHRARARIPLAVFATGFELFCGLGGIVLLFLWFGTEHRAAWRNENLFLLNPLCLLLIPAWIGSARARWAVRRTTIWIAWLVVLCAAFALFSKILPWFVQANLAWIVLFLPIHLALAIAMRQASRRMALDSP